MYRVYYSIFVLIHVLNTCINKAYAYAVYMMYVNVMYIKLMYILLTYIKVMYVKGMYDRPAKQSAGCKTWVFLDRPEGSIWL